MKKFLALFLAMIMLVSFAACKDEKTSENSAANTTENSDDPISVDENLLTVDITLPLSMFEDKTAEEIKAEAEENGIKKCVVNEEDGTVIYTVSKAKHKELIEEMKKSVEKTCDDLINGDEKVESFVDIKYNDDFSQFDIYVDKSKYTVWDSMNAMAFYMLGAYNQCISGVDFDDVDIVINFIDKDTGEVLNTSSYDEFKENASKQE